MLYKFLKDCYNEVETGVNMNLDYDVFIFDLYGTLIDIETDEHAPEVWKDWMQVLDRYGISHPDAGEFHRAFFELDTNKRQLALSEGRFRYPEIEILEVYDELFSGYGNRRMSLERLRELAYAFRVCSRKHIRLYPAAEDFLKKLRSGGRRVYILSNAQSSYTVNEIRMFHLDELTDDYLISSDYRCMKPDVKFFEALIEKHAIRRERAVMIGDSEQSDMRGAVESNLHHIHLTGYNHPDQFYTQHISEIIE